MPFTALHMEPGLALKALAGQQFSVLTDMTPFVLWSTANGGLWLNFDRLVRKWQQRTTVDD